MPIKFQSISLTSFPSTFLLNCSWQSQGHPCCSSSLQPWSCLRSCFIYFSPLLQTYHTLFIPVLWPGRMKPMTEALVSLSLFFQVDLSNGEASKRSEGGNEHEVRTFPFLSFLMLPSFSVGAGATSLNLRSQLQSGRLSTQLSLPPSSNNHLSVTYSSLVMITAPPLSLAAED